MAIELQYPLGSYSVDNPPSNNTLMNDLSNIQTAVNSGEVAIAALDSEKADASALTAHEADTSTHGVATVAGISETQTLTNKTLSTGTKLDANADGNITQYGMARQAIMNGNFDIWQRGASVSIVDVTSLYLADRWYDLVDKNGGILPTLTRSRQAHTPGDIANALYFTRLASNGSGTSLGVNSYGVYAHKIENGTSKLCGDGKKITLSFWARSSIANKRICPTIHQIYGTGGSPSTTEIIQGTPITLTSTWTKYIVTFETNSLVGKTFGTANDDHLAIRLNYMWGTTFGNTYIQNGVTAETFVGAGNIDIAQVQLCSGDVAIPFQPKSFEEELRACQRYYEEGVSNWVGYSTSGSFHSDIVRFKATKRIIPTITQANTYASGFGTTPAQSSIAVDLFRSQRQATSTTPSAEFRENWTASAEL